MLFERLIKGEFSELSLGIISQIARSKHCKNFSSRFMIFFWSRVWTTKVRDLLLLIVFYLFTCFTRKKPLHVCVSVSWTNIKYLPRILKLLPCSFRFLHKFVFLLLSFSSLETAHGKKWLLIALHATTEPENWFISYTHIARASVTWKHFSPRRKSPH